MWILSATVGRFQVFFLSYLALGFQLWFYFHLCMWVIHWGLLLRLPCVGRVWRWCSCLGLRGSGSTRYSGELVARAEGNIVLWKGMATSIGQYAPVSLPGEAPSLTEKPGRPQSTGMQRVGHDQNNPEGIEARFFACGSSAPVRVGHEGGAAAWLAGTLAEPSVQGQGLPPPQELWPCQSLFSSLL